MFRQQYDSEQCTHLAEDTDDTDEEEDPTLFVPEPYDDTLTPGHTEDQQTDHDEEQQNWLQLQNVSSITVQCSVMCGSVEWAGLDIKNKADSGMLNILCLI